jgi:hypothetical protein
LLAIPQVAAASLFLACSMTLVGYNDDATVPYWIIQNSWGTGWGEAVSESPAVHSPAFPVHSNRWPGASSAAAALSCLYGLASQLLLWVQP